MADSVDDVELGSLQGRFGPGASTPSQQIRRSLRDKHVCPFCGMTRASEGGPCAQCSLEDTPTTRAATRSKLGPWFVLQSRNPSAPGMAFSTLLLLIQKGRVTARSVIRGPTTSQFWRHAAKVKGVSREFGLCWGCGQDVARNARVCATCKRLQEPPINPDVLLENGSDGGTEGISEKAWAEDAASAGSSAVDQLTAKGPIRRAVPPPAPPPAPARQAPVAPPLESDAADVGAGLLPRRARRRDLPDGDNPRETGLLDGLHMAMLGGASSQDDPSRRAAAAYEGRESPLRRRPPVGFGVGYDDEYLDLGRRRHPGGLFRKLFKILLVALLLAAIGVGAIAYLDPEGAGRRLREHATSAWRWTKAKVRPDAKPAPAPAPSVNAARDTSDPRAAATEPSIPAEDFSKLTPEQAKYKVYQLWDEGETAAAKGELKRAVALWESIKRFPGVKPEDWPLGLDARIDQAKRKVK